MASCRRAVVVNSFSTSRRSNHNDTTPRRPTAGQRRAPKQNTAILSTGLARPHPAHPHSPTVCEIGAICGFALMFAGFAGGTDGRSVTGARLGGGSQDLGHAAGDVRGDRSDRARSRGCAYACGPRPPWDCPGGDSNPHSLKATWPSTMRVCQFRHPGGEAKGPIGWEPSTNTPP